MKSTRTPLEFYKTPTGEVTKINITDHSNYKHIQLLADATLKKLNSTFKNKDNDLKVITAAVNSYPDFVQVYEFFAELNYQNCTSPCSRDIRYKNFH